MSEPEGGPTPADPDDTEGYAPGRVDEGSTTDRDDLDDLDDPADDDPGWFDRFADKLMDRVARQFAEHRARSEGRPR